MWEEKCNTTKKVKYIYNTKNIFKKKKKKFN